MSASTYMRAKTTFTTTVHVLTAGPNVEQVKIITCINIKRLSPCYTLLP